MVRWNALDPNDPNTALIVPRDDLRAVEAEVARLRAAIDEALAILGNTKATNYEKVQAAGLVLASCNAS